MNPKVLDATYTEAAKVNAETRKGLEEIREASDRIERHQEWVADADFWRFVKPFRSSKPGQGLANT